MNFPGFSYEMAFRDNEYTQTVVTNKWCKWGIQQLKALQHLKQ